MKTLFTLWTALAAFTLSAGAQIITSSNSAVLTSLDGVFGNATNAPLVVVVGDSTADWFMPVSTTDPAHPADVPGSPYVKNSKTWPALLETELRHRGPVKFVNLAVAGRRLYDIDATLYAAEITPYLPKTGQTSTLIICAGHNDFNYSTGQDPTARATDVYAYATSLRAKAFANGFTKVVIVCPTWYHTHGLRDVVFSRLAAADSAWTQVIDQGYYAGFSLGWKDGVHQNADGHKVLAKRILAQCWDGINLLTAVDLDCGPGGVFPTVRAAMEWKQERRAYSNPTVRDYRVVGDIYCEWQNLADGTEANHYGDGVFVGNGGSSNNILLLPGTTLNVQARMNYDSTAAPTALTIRGKGRLNLLSNLNLLESTGTVPTRISCDEYFVPSGLNWVGRGLNLRISSKLQDYSSTTLNAIGGLYSDSSFGVIVGPDSFIRSTSGFIINSSAAGSYGVRILPGCKLARLDGGVVDNPGAGTVYFYPGVFMSNLTVGSGHSWTGTTPTILTYTDL